MAKVYFSKFNINSKIYDIYKDQSIKNEILHEIFNSMSSNTQIPWGRIKGESDAIDDFGEEEDDKDKVCRFGVLSKDDVDLTVAGYLIKVDDYEYNTYDEATDSLNPGRILVP